MKSKIFLMTFIFVLIQCQISPASTVDLSKGKGDVEFNTVIVPGSIKLHGKGDAAKGSINVVGHEVKGVLTFDLNSLTTERETRDKHMKEKYLETNKFPGATLKILKMTLPKNISMTKFDLDRVDFEGELELHGEKKPVKGFSKIKVENKNVEFDTDFEIALKEFKIDEPRFAGVKVLPTIKVTTHHKAPVQE